MIGNEYERRNSNEKTLVNNNEENEQIDFNENNSTNNNEDNIDSRRSIEINDGNDKLYRILKYNKKISRPQLVGVIEDGKKEKFELQSVNNSEDNEDNDNEWKIELTYNNEDNYLYTNLCFNSNEEQMGMTFNCTYILKSQNDENNIIEDNGHYTVEGKSFTTDVKKLIKKNDIKELFEIIVTIKIIKDLDNFIRKMQNLIRKNEINVGNYENIILGEDYEEPIIKRKGKKHKLSSKSFNIAGYEWKLHLRFVNNNLSLLLECKDTEHFCNDDDNVKIKYVIYFRNNDKTLIKEYHTTEFVNFTKKESISECKKFMTKPEYDRMINNNRNNFIIGIYIRVYNESNTINITDISRENYIKNFERTIRRDISSIKYRLKDFHSFKYIINDMDKFIKNVNHKDYKKSSKLKIGNDELYIEYQFGIRLDRKEYIKIKLKCKSNKDIDMAGFIVSLRNHNDYSQYIEKVENEYVLKENDEVEVDFDKIRIKNNKFEFINNRFEIDICAFYYMERNMVNNNEFINISNDEIRELARAKENFTAYVYDDEISILKDEKFYIINDDEDCGFVLGISEDKKIMIPKNVIKYIEKCESEENDNSEDNNENSNEEEDDNENEDDSEEENDSDEE